MPLELQAIFIALDLTVNTLQKKSYKIVYLFQSLYKTNVE